MTHQSSWPGGPAAGPVAGGPQPPGPYPQGAGWRPLPPSAGHAGSPGAYAGPPGPATQPNPPAPATGWSAPPFVPLHPPNRRTGILPAVAAAVATALVFGGAAGFGAGRLATGSIPAVPRQPAGGAPAPAGPDAAAVADRLLTSTVTIAYKTTSTGGTGSGFVLDAAGHIVTNNHVIEGAVKGNTQLMVEFSDGGRVPASVVGRSPSYDLAVIKVTPDRPLVPVQRGDSAKVRAGQGVIAVGAPLGLGGSVTSGIVSAVDRPFGVGDEKAADESEVTYINGIQTDAPINPGNSGGPLADSAGRVIGVNSAILTLGSGTTGSRGGNIGLGFAIPINQALVIVDEIIRNGRATYPVIGAGVTANNEGVRLTNVAQGGPAESAGLRSGDVVTAVGGRAVDTPTDLIVRVRSHRPGQKVDLTVKDRGPVSVTLGSRVG